MLYIFIYLFLIILNFGTSFVCTIVSKYIFKYLSFCLVVLKTFVYLHHRNGTTIRIK